MSFLIEIQQRKTQNVFLRKVFRAETPSGFKVALKRILTNDEHQVTTVQTKRLGSLEKEVVLTTLFK
jgi:hypothetical protein